MIRELVTHVVVSSVILALALAAAAWIRPLTARTRHMILVGGMAALALPSPLVSRLVEQTPMATMIGAPAGLLAASALLTTPLQSEGERDWRWAVILYFTVAVVLFLRWWLITHRLVATAVRAATPPPARAKRALDAARSRLGLKRSVDLIASPTCEAPAVVRVFRPMIILPADGCETLDDDELESLLCHECAHVARRDNLIGVIEAIVCSLFWFNPLVWLAHRRIAAAREAACDERVADAALPAETYVGALAKICRSLLAPRIPAVSCMANAHLKERIQHLMSYDTLRQSAFSHRIILAFVITAVLAAVAGAGVVTAKPLGTKAKEARYHLNYSMNKTAAGEIEIRARVTDRLEKTVVGAPSVTVKPGERGEMKFSRETNAGTQSWTINVETVEDGSGALTMLVERNGVDEQSTRVEFKAPGPNAPARTYTGEPISLALSNAEIKDVLRTFGRISGLEVSFAEGVEGRVNVHIVDQPWDQALDDILRENGLAYRLDGSAIHFYKR